MKVEIIVIISNGSIIHPVYGVGVKHMEGIYNYMKKIFFIALILTVCTSLHYPIYGESVNDNIDNLYRRYNICPIFSSLKGDNLYVLTENGPENGPKYGENTEFNRSGSEIGYYNLKTQVYTKLFVKYFKDNTYGAIKYFRVDDSQEYIFFTELMCVGQIQQNDRYAYKYSINDNSACITYFEQYFGFKAEEDKKVKSQIFDKEYFSNTSKISALLKEKLSVTPYASNSDFKFFDNKLFITKDNLIDGNLFTNEIGYINLDTDNYVKLLCKKVDSKKSAGKLKLIGANYNEIVFEDNGNNACIKYCYTIGTDTISIIDCRFCCCNISDTISSLNGTKIKLAEFKDIGLFSEIVGLSSICKLYPDIRDGKVLNNKLYVIISNNWKVNAQGGQKFGFIDLKTYKYTQLIEKSKKNSEEFNGEFVRLYKDKEFIYFTESESNSFLNAEIDYEYSPVKNILFIRDARLNTLKFGNNQIKFNNLKDMKIKPKNFNDIEYYFKIKNITGFINKYSSIKEGFIKNNKLYIITRNGISSTSFTDPKQAGEIGYIDLKTNKYKRLLRKAGSQTFAGELHFKMIGNSSIGFSDSTDTARIYYTLSLTGKALKIEEATNYINGVNGFRYLVGNKVRISGFKDILQYDFIEPVLVV